MFIKICIYTCGRTDKDILLTLKIMKYASKVPWEGDTNNMLMLESFVDQHFNFINSY